MKKHPLLIALTVLLLGIALLMVPTVGANSTLTQAESYPDSAGIAPGNPAGAPELVNVSLALESMMPISPAYGTDVQNNFLAQLDLTDPATLTNTGFSPAIFAADLAIDNELVYAIVSNNSPAADEFITFDLTTPATPTVIGPITPAAGEEWGGMAVVTLNNKIYASSTQCGTRSTLYTINPATGVATQVGQITGSPCISAIAADASGMLWGVDNTNDNLVTIDDATGASTAVGPLDFNANFNQGLEYNENDNALYLAAFNLSAFEAQLHELDTSNGSTVMSDTIGDTSPGGIVQMGWLGIPSPTPDPIPEIAAITLDKTVGTDAGSCATEDDIFVDEGEMVYYCYTVTNVGDITLTNHTLEDSELGMLLTDTVVSLAPTASYSVTQSASIMETTVNTATWTATAGMTETTAIDTAMVTVIPENGSAPNADIPDDNSTGVNDTISITETGVLTDLNVYLDIHHPWVGDLVVTLEHEESGMSVELVNRPEAMTTTHALAAPGDCDGDNIHNTLDDDATPSIQTDCQGGDGMPAYMMGARYQPAGSLDDFAAAAIPFSGTWEINVVDASPTQEGTFVIWALDGSVGEPEIDVVPMSITDTLGLDDTSTHPLTINNSGDAALSWEISSDVAWASVDTVSGTTAISDSSPLVVTFDSTGLATGTYTGTLAIENNDADENPVIVDLMLTVETMPSITLDKTVGTDPAVCATTDSIRVTEGTEVYYCYEVTNTGDITLALHDLDDSELGMILDGFALDLAPAASAQVTATATIMTDTTNVATWTAYNAGPTDVVSDTASATVQISAPDPLVCNGPMIEFEAGIPGDWATLNNTGNVFWSTTDDLAACDNGGNQTNGSGEAACADADETNNAGDPYSAELRTNPFDIDASVGLATLNFEVAYRDIATADMFEVDISTDGGATWDNLLSWNENHYAPGESVALDLTSYAGQTGLIVRYHYFGDGWDWYAHVDEVMLECGDAPLLPEIDVNPTSMSATQGSDEVTSQILTIENTGDADLDWMIEEDDTTTPVVPEGDVNRAGPTAAVDADFAAKHAADMLNSGDIVMDGGFEGGTPSTFWNETSTNFGTPLCDEASCGTGGGTSGANSGAWWVWFGGVLGAEDGTVDQDVTIPVGSNSLTFFFWIGTVSGANTDFMEVLIDGNQVWVATEADAGTYAAYTEVTVDISAYADGGTHNLMFHGAQPTGTSNFNVDDVSIAGDPVPAACEAPSDIPWLSVSPTSGTTAPSESDDVTVTFDSTDLMPGDYTGNLCVSSNDDDEALVTVPVTLTVALAPAIELVKTVGTEMGVCATTDVITVTEGTDVYYCYTVTNTGNVTLPLHDLDDDQLGMLLDDFAFDLAPGATVSTVDAGEEISTQINATTMNTATWTAFGDGVSAEASASATVNVESSTAVEMAELATSSSSNLPLALAVAGMMLVLAGGFVVRRRRTQ